MSPVAIDSAMVGDLVEVSGHRVGDAAREGVITDVLGDPHHPHFRVRWEDGRVSILFPGADVVIRHPPRESRR